MPRATSPVLRFGPFELDLRTRELRRNGARVVVQDQPLRVLATLLERPGELVTRDELHRRLWPADTFVDFEHGLNAAIRRLRAALGDRSGTPAYVETLPRRGYRFVAPCEGLGAERAPETSAPLTRLLALPFRVLRSDPDSDFLAESVPDAVASTLSGLRSLVVRPTVMGARYAKHPLDLARIAQEAEVEALLTGTVARAGDQVRIAAQLIGVPGAAVLWSHDVQISFGNLFALQDEAVQGIVNSLSLSLSARERTALRADVPASPRGYELYLRANRILMQGLRGGAQLEVARDLYHQALAEDPRYAPAWARLGRCHWLIAKGVPGAAPQLEEADACFRRALALNPDLLLAHALHAQLEADLGHAPQAMVRLLGLTGAGVTTPEVYATLVQVCRFCGQLEASIAAAERARGLDPQIPTSANHTYWHLGDANRAFAASSPGTFYLDARILSSWGRDAEAVDLLRRREPDLPPTTRAFAVSLRALIEGARDQCLEATTQALAHWPDPEGRYYLATHLARLGEADRALCELEQSLDRGFVAYRVLGWDPFLDALRPSPGFAALRERAAARYQEACVAFADAGGHRLFGL